MIDVSELLWFLAFSILSLAIWVRTIKTCRIEDIRPLVFYSLFYGATIWIGASLVALSNGELLRHRIDTGINIELIRDSFGFRYWAVLFSPFIALPLITPLFLRIAWVPGFVNDILRKPVRMMPYLIACFLVTTVCLMYFSRVGFSDSLTAILSTRGNYEEFIQNRSAYLSKLGLVGVSLIYMTVPGLAYIALFKAVRERSLKWAMVGVLLVGLSSALTALTMQKSLIVLNILFLAIGCIVLLRLRIKYLLVAFIAATMVLTYFQTYVMSTDWMVFDTLKLMIFRASSSFPFYLKIYPGLEQYFGVDWLFDGKSPRDNQIVFNYMFPSVTFIQGSVAAPSLLKAFSQGGYFYLAVELALIGFFCAVIGKIKSVRENELSFCVFMQCLVFLYYTTQVSIMQATVSSYGLFWGLLGVSLVIFCNQFRLFRAGSVQFIS